VTADVKESLEARLARALALRDKANRVFASAIAGRVDLVALDTVIEVANYAITQVTLEIFRIECEIRERTK
jgi:hypothetical protein